MLMEGYFVLESAKGVCEHERTDNHNYLNSRGALRSVRGMNVL